MLLATVCPCQESDFVADLSALERAVERGQWKVAERRLASLLEDHRDADYARRERVRITELAKQCAFHLSFPTPEPEEVVSGDLETYNASSGRIRIRYAPRTLDDFLLSTGTPQTTGMYVHPLIFDGNHSISVQGDRYPSDGVSFLVCATEDTAYRVDLRSPVRIERREKGMWHELAKRVITLGRAREPFTARVRVTGTSIVLHFDGKLVLQARKERGEFGQLAFTGRSFTEVVIEGNANTAWIQGRIDAVVNRARADFARTFDPRTTLPAWLHADTPSPSETVEFPEQLDPNDRSALLGTMDLITGGNYERAFASLVALRERAPLSTTYLAATTYVLLGQSTIALRLIEMVCAEKPDFVDGRVLRARIHEQLRERETALAEYRAVIRDHPVHESAIANAATLLLRMGRTEEAAEMLDDARQAGAGGEQLDGVERNLLSVERGPRWERRFESKSRTFHVQSDIDAGACSDARNVLEAAHNSFQSEFGWLRRGEQSEPMRVYLFAGEAGYKAYCENLWGMAPPHTAGLYSPELKQLLIWNLPDRDAMMRTVRHEGWHQYLDSIMDDPPIWLNEGLAEYVEIAEHRGGRFTGEGIHTSHLVTLKRNQMPKLSEFVALSREAFYQNSQLHYAQAWALVHFLRHSSRENKELFDQVFEALQEGSSSTEGFEDALGERTMDELDTEFRAYLRTLG